MSVPVTLSCVFHQEELASQFVNCYTVRLICHSVATWFLPWWRHQMETFFALLAFCAGNSPVTGEFPAQRPVTRIFDVFFDLRLNKRLSKQSWGWWFETPSCPLWRHCNALANGIFYFIWCLMSRPLCVNHILMIIKSVSWALIRMGIGCVHTVCFKMILYETNLYMVLACILIPRGIIQKCRYNANNDSAFIFWSHTNLMKKSACFSTIFELPNEFSWNHVFVDGNNIYCHAL